MANGFEPGPEDIQREIARRFAGQNLDDVPVDPALLGEVGGLVQEESPEMQMARRKEMIRAELRQIREQELDAEVRELVAKRRQEFDKEASEMFSS